MDDIKLNPGEQCQESKCKRFQKMDEVFSNLLVLFVHSVSEGFVVAAAAVSM